MNDIDKNVVRKCARYCFLLVGVILLIIFCLTKLPELKHLLLNHLSTILWGAGWSSVGIGLGLWVAPKDVSKDKDPKTHEPSHYFGYFLFVWFTATVAACSVFLANGGLQAYGFSLLTGIAIGFAGDALAGIIIKGAKISSNS